MTCSQTGLSDPLRFALIVTRARRRHGWSSPVHGGSCRPSRLGSGSVAEVIEAAAADGAHRWGGDDDGGVPVGKLVQAPADLPGKPKGGSRRAAGWGDGGEADEFGADFAQLCRHGGVVGVLVGGPGFAVG